MKVDPATTGLAFTDLHNDFLAPNGKAYPLIEQSLTKNNTAHNIERLLRTGGISVAEFEPQVRHLRPRVRDIVGVQDLGHASIRL